jgi:enoyl-CoA hydratase/3-hydroxyacyl-CoA dehydrogenase
MVEKVKKFTVVGAGSMGHGIAELAAIAGFEVWINDISNEILKNAIERIKWSLSKLYERGQIKEDVEKIVSRIHPTVNQDEALKDTDFMIEAVIEDINIKRQVFSKADQLSSPNAVLASNTSSLPITEIAQATKRPERVVGMHFFNPPVLMPLVEIIRGEKTSEETVKIAYEMGKRLGKEPIVINKDIPGFLVNRILFRINDIACILVEKGKADIIDIDATAIYELGFPMGIFLLQDYAGVDVGYLVGKAMMERGFKAYECKLLEEKYRSKSFGVKSGRGFYNYPEPNKFVRPEIPKERTKKVNGITIIAPAVNEAAYLLREKIVSKEDIDKGCKLGLGWPKGLLEYADEYGIDNIVSTLESIRKETGLEYFAPDSLLIQMVNEGKLGRKSGIGFYEYGKVQEKKLNTLVVKIEEPIGWIILNRPERLNALNQQLLKELNQTLDELEENEKIKVIIITGTGRAFCAGADITEFLTQSPIKSMINSRRIHEIFNKIQFLTKPVIAAINGYALGGGLELAMACDIRIASFNAQLGQPEINLGLIPGAGGTQRLPRLVKNRKLELIMTGDMVSAKDALDLGLVDYVVEHDKLESEARKLALKLSEKPPLALMAAKYAVNFGLQSNIWSGGAYEASLFGLLFSTKDFQEGVRAFLDKRKPTFKGE